MHVVGLGLLQFVCDRAFVHVYDVFKTKHINILKKNRFK